jgi:hypothetical protein
LGRRPPIGFAWGQGLEHHFGADAARVAEGNG